MEATRLVLRWREGKLEARFDGMPGLAAVLGLRAGDGRPLAHRLGPEHGEALRIVRAADGSVERSGLGGLPGHARAGAVARAGVARYSYWSASSTLSLAGAARREDRGDEARR